MKVKIKILGVGCTRCNTLAELTNQVIREGGFETEVRKTGDIEEILSYKVFSTPALVINEKVVVSGRVPTKEEIRNYILNADKE